MTDPRADRGAGAASTGDAAVLVVEDFLPLRVLLERVLHAEGHRITAVETARAAQDACAPPTST